MPTEIQRQYFWDVNTAISTIAEGAFSISLGPGFEVGALSFGTIGGFASCRYQATYDDVVYDRYFVVLSLSAGQQVPFREFAKIPGSNSQVNWFFRVGEEAFPSWGFIKSQWLAIYVAFRRQMIDAWTTGVPGDTASGESDSSTSIAKSAIVSTLVQTGAEMLCYNDQLKGLDADAGTPDYSFSTPPVMTDAVGSVAISSQIAGIEGIAKAIQDLTFQTRFTWIDNGTGIADLMTGDTFTAPPGGEEG